MDNQEREILNNPKYSKEQKRKVRIFFFKGKVHSFFDRIIKNRYLNWFLKKIVYPITIAVIGFLIGMIIWTKYYQP